jgi:hypothetical protein
MKKKKRKFPYWIHLVLGLIWIVIGITLYSGTASVIWVCGGLMMAVIGTLNKRQS